MRRNSVHEVLWKLSIAWSVVACSQSSSHDDQANAQGGSTVASGGTTRQSNSVGSGEGGAELGGSGTSKATTGRTSLGGTGAKPSSSSSAGQSGAKGGASQGGRSSGAGGASSSAKGGTSSTKPASTVLSAAGAGSEGEPGVRFVGRVDRSDPAKPRFAWSGTGVVARFEGTSVSVHLSGSQYYTVLIDGQVKSNSQQITGNVTLAEGLDAGVHTVEFYRRTEADQGDAQFLGFDFAGGTLLAAPAAPTRRLEIVGDSITCGYGDEGPNESCKFTPQTENHYLTYAAIAARNLGAELNTIAWSGKGVVCNYGDDATSCTNPMPTYYDRTLPNNTTSQWDFAAFQPDAVIINLGTNDFSTNDDPTEAEFEDGYQEFLQHIRSKNPNAYILCTNGPMLTGTDLSTVRTYIAKVVKTLNDAGDARIGTFEITPQDSADGLGCDWHPNLVTHQKMAEQLESALKSALKW